jgi:hypothetical protein
MSGQLPDKNIIIDGEKNSTNGSNMKNVWNIDSRSNRDNIHNIEFYENDSEAVQNSKVV